MPTAQISETVQTPIDDEEAWDRRFQGILDGTHAPLSDEEIIAEAARRYAELRSGKARGFSLDEHRRFGELAEAFPLLSDEEILEKVDQSPHGERRVSPLAMEEYEVTAS